MLKWIKRRQDLNHVLILETENFKKVSVLEAEENIFQIACMWLKDFNLEATYSTLLGFWYTICVWITNNVCFYNS